MSDPVSAPAEINETSAPPSLRRALVRVILIVAALALLVAGVLWFLNYQSVGKYQQSTNDAYVQADGVTVSPKVSGYVDRVYVAENQMVRAGDPLVLIDARDYRAQADQVEAQIAVARANAAGVQAQIGEQQAAIGRAEADLAAARTDAGFAHGEGRVTSRSPPPARKRASGWSN